MSLRMKSAALATLLVLGSLGLSAMPAHASASGGVVHGTGDWRDDWSDEGDLSQSAYAHSNVAAMWQAILWADGRLSSTADIDCIFGPTTHTATRVWQQDRRLEDDGIVGKNTFSAASRNLSGASGSGNQIVYHGAYGGRYVTFTRVDNGRWGMYIGSELKTLWYNDATFSACS
ncbi:peptidoglycan-binding domain-containing protein [Micromonospora echinospora]|uniref:peptidoglycan-binding domain-containing protein n=1 Tax=Micromonospora echinospora TaxID=1877 RepID=UPI003A86417E